jgi:uncharacterized protein (TIGR01777 family)
MVIALSGSSGLIGSALTVALEQEGHEVRRLVRRAVRSPYDVSWDPDAGTIDVARLAGVDAAVNLAGENLAQRWTDDVKQRIRASRVKSTALLSASLAGLPVKPRVLLSGSAVGIYGDRGDEELDEESALGTDFLSRVCKDWEQSTARASDAGIRVAHLRTGLVLARDGGALPRMLMPFRLGVGGRLGNGRQWMSWISLTDVVAAICFLLTADAIAGPVNMVAPNPATNAEFTRTLAAVMHRPALFAVPKFALELALGEMADETVLASQRVRPRRLLAANYSFRESALERALRTEL